MGSEHVLLLPGLIDFSFAQGCILDGLGCAGLTAHSLCCFLDQAHTRTDTHTHPYTSTRLTTHIVSKAPLAKSFRCLHARELVLHLRE